MSAVYAPHQLLQSLVLISLCVFVRHNFALKLINAVGEDMHVRLVEIISGAVACKITIIAAIMTI